MVWARGEEWEDSWINKCRDIKVEGTGKRGRPPMSWGEVLRGDLKERGISPSCVGDRDKWRAACKQTHCVKK